MEGNGSMDENLMSMDTLVDPFVMKVLICDEFNKESDSAFTYVQLKEYVNNAKVTITRDEIKKYLDKEFEKNCPDLRKRVMEANYSNPVFELFDRIDSEKYMFSEDTFEYFNTYVGDMLELPYDNESMDCILCYNVISHSDTEGVKKIINELKRVLKVNGECYLTLCSKDTWGFKQDWPMVDANTKLRMEEGPEYEVPHFYADYELIKELFKDFEIVFVNQLEKFFEKDGKPTTSSHYHVLVKKIVW